MSEHICTCANCDPSLASPSERLSPDHHHCGKFPDSIALRGAAKVFLDGVDVSRTVYEFLVGEDGWVLEFSEDEGGHKHFCKKLCWVGTPEQYEQVDEDEADRRHHAHICRRRRTGKVELKVLTAV